MHVGAGIRVRLALANEWRTVYEVRPRLERLAMSIIQPEMGHAGISRLMQIGRLANAFHVEVISHAGVDVGVGICQATSLHAAAALPNRPMHECQHSVSDRNLQLVTTTMRCENGAFPLQQGAGLGIQPRPDVWQFLRSKSA